MIQPQMLTEELVTKSFIHSLMHLSTHSPNRDLCIEHLCILCPWHILGVWEREVNKKDEILVLLELTQKIHSEYLKW